MNCKWGIFVLFLVLHRDVVWKRSEESRFHGRGRVLCLEEAKGRHDQLALSTRTDKESCSLPVVLPR